MFAQLFLRQHLEMSQHYHSPRWFSAGSGTHLTHRGWQHLGSSCPVGAQPGWDTSLVCPLTKRLVRLMIDQPEPFDIYKGVPMVVQHAPPLAPESLRPQNMDAEGSSRSMVSWGCGLLRLCASVRVSPCGHRFGTLRAVSSTPATKVAATEFHTNLCPTIHMPRAQLLPLNRRTCGS